MATTNISTLGVVARHPRNQNRAAAAGSGGHRNRGAERSGRSGVKFQRSAAVAPIA